jgi:hypothetical protein
LFIFYSLGNPSPQPQPKNAATQDPGPCISSPKEKAECAHYSEDSQISSSSPSFLQLAKRQTREREWLKDAMYKSATIAMFHRISILFMLIAMVNIFFARDSRGAISAVGKEFKQQNLKVPELFNSIEG